MEYGQQDEGEEEIGSWFPLLDLFWYNGQRVLSPKEAEEGSEEVGRAGERRGEGNSIT